MSFRNFDAHYIEEMNVAKETSISLMKHFMIDLSFLLPQYYLNILNMINTHFSYTSHILMMVTSVNMSCVAFIIMILLGEKIRMIVNLITTISKYDRNKEHYLYEIFNTITYTYHN